MGTRRRRNRRQKERTARMSEHVDGVHRKQTILFPDTLDEYVDKGNPVRFIDAFINSLNLEKLGFKHSVPNDVGRPSYDPSDLLKLYVYGYLCLLYTSDAADDLLCVDLGGRRIIKKK